MVASAHLADFGLGSLYNHMSQFFQINKQKHSVHTQIHTHTEVLFFCTVLTNTTETVTVKLQRSEHTLEDENSGTHLKE